MIKISSIHASDLEQLATLYEDLIGAQSNIVRMQDMFEKIKINPDYLLIGAKNESQQLVGSVMGIVCTDMVGDCRPFMVLENMIVRKNKRTKGIGKALVEHLEACARKRNCYYMMLVSLAKRKDAHSFYEKVGYPLGVVQGFKKYL